MKWRILFFIFLMPITGHLGAQHLIEGKYLPEPVLKTGSDDPKYGYAIYKVEKGKDRIFTLISQGICEMIHLHISYFHIIPLLLLPSRKHILQLSSSLLPSYPALLQKSEG